MPWHARTRQGGTASPGRGMVRQQGEMLWGRRCPWPCCRGHGALAGCLWQWAAVLTANKPPERTTKHHRSSVSQALQPPLATVAVVSLIQPRFRAQPEGVGQAPAPIPRPWDSEAPRRHHQQHSYFQAEQMRVAGLLHTTRWVDELRVDDEIWPERCWGSYHRFTKCLCERDMHLSLGKHGLRGPPGTPRWAETLISSRCTKSTTDGNSTKILQKPL